MSKGVSPARRLAFDLLQEILFQGAFANIALDKALFSSSLDSKDKGLTTELVYGTVKYRDRLTYMIDHFSKIPVKKMDHKTAVILLMGAYQIDQLSKIPKHAIVHEAVGLAKMHKLSSEKLINAVLRSLLRSQDAIPWPNSRKQKAGYLAKTQSFPQWMVDMWLKKFGYQRTKALCEYFNRPAQIWLRTNTLKTSREDLIQRLQKEGAEVIPGSLVPESICYLAGPSFRDLTSFQEGLFSIQDQAAMLVAHAVNPQPGERILDMCAAPGGKTCHMASLMKDRGQILALDIHAHRTQLIRDNARRLGLLSVYPKTQDAGIWEETFYLSFDRVLLDAPCSGLGVLNRRPDARWQKRRSQIPGLVDLQAHLLDEAAKLLKVGGRLVYATCTLVDEENKGQVDAFLERHREFRLVDDLDQHWQGLSGPDGMRELHPDVDGTDGFFMAGLEKVGLYESP